MFLRRNPFERRTGRPGLPKEHTSGRRTSKVSMLFFEEERSSLPTGAADGIAPYFNPVETAVAFRSVARAAVQIRETDLIDAAQIDVRSPCSISRYVHSFLVQHAPAWNVGYIK